MLHLRMFFCNVVKLRGLTACSSRRKYSFHVVVGSVDDESERAGDTSSDEEDELEANAAGWKTGPSRSEGSSVGDWNRLPVSRKDWDDVGGMRMLVSGREREPLGADVDTPP
jgi:hypothetical protein